MQEDTDPIPDIFICPITYMIMNDPVACSDGHVYEREAIEESIECRTNSPLTNTPIDKNFYSLLPLRESINNYLEKNPHKKSEQYVPGLKKYNEMFIDVSKILSLQKPELNEMMEQLYRRTREKRMPIIRRILTNSTVTRYLIDNIDWNYEINGRDGQTRQFINIIITYANKKDIIYALEKFIRQTAWLRTNFLIHKMGHISYDKVVILLSCINDDKVYILKNYKDLIIEIINYNIFLKDKQKLKLKKIIEKKIVGYEKKYEKINHQMFLFDRINNIFKKKEYNNISN